MPRSVSQLLGPGGPLFLTDGGLETFLVFQQGVDLPAFAAFDLLRTERGREELVRYYESFLEIAAEAGSGFVLESPTWRASVDWAGPTAHSPEQIDAANRAGVQLLLGLRERWAARGLPIVVSGCVGPRGDGYDPGTLMTEAEARTYHRRQVLVLARAGAELINGVTMTNVPEAIGLVQAARAAAIPVVVSFTVETDGRLPSGDDLGSAVRAVDEATDAAPAYYMLNCAHPTHFLHPLESGEPWVRRVQGLRPNASRCSHAELDESPVLDEGNPAELGGEIASLVRQLPGLRVLGGCCGTDTRHVRAIAEACTAREPIAVPA